MPAKRAMVCAPLMPEFDRESGSKRIFDLICFLREEGWAVSFVAGNARDGNRYATALQQMGVAVYHGFGPNVEQLIAHGRLDLALFAFWHLAESHAPLVRRLSQRTHIVVDSIDLHFVRNARKLISGGNRLESGFALEMARELNTYAAADGVLTVSRKEANLIADFCGDSTRVYAIPDSEDLDPSTVPFDQRKGIVFIGNFRHAPNLGAVEYLCRQIVPRIDPRLLEQHPLSIVGNALDERIMALGKGLPNVRMVGWVPSVLPYLERARMSVIPLLYGAGTKRKLLQSMMLGTPAVSTTVGIEGFDLRDEQHVLVADAPKTFAANITRLLEDESLWRHLSREGGEHVRARHRHATARARLSEALADIATKSPKSATEFATSTDYADLVAEVRRAICAAAPDDATVLVVNKGDTAMLQLDGRRGWHFPQDSRGNFAGHYPANGAEAIKHLKVLRDKGAQFLVIPSTSTWWLNYYSEFGEYLEQNCRLVHRTENVCSIYDIAGQASKSQRPRMAANSHSSGETP